MSAKVNHCPLIQSMATMENQMVQKTDVLVVENLEHEGRAAQNSATNNRRKQFDPKLVSRPQNLSL